MTKGCAAYNYRNSLAFILLFIQYPEPLLAEVPKAMKEDPVIFFVIHSDGLWPIQSLWANTSTRHFMTVETSAGKHCKTMNTIHGVSSQGSQNQTDLI